MLNYYLCIRQLFVLTGPSWVHNGCIVCSGEPARAYWIDIFHNKEDDPFLQKERAPRHLGPGLGRNKAAGTRLLRPYLPGSRHYTKG